MALTYQFCKSLHEFLFNFIFAFSSISNYCLLRSLRYRYFKLFKSLKIILELLYTPNEHSCLSLLKKRSFKSTIYAKQSASSAKYYFLYNWRLSHGLRYIVSPTLISQNCKMHSLSVQMRRHNSLPGSVEVNIYKRAKLLLFVRKNAAAIAQLRKCFQLNACRKMITNNF